MDEALAEAPGDVGYRGLGPPPFGRRRCHPQRRAKELAWPGGRRGENVDRAEDGVGAPRQRGEYLHQPLGRAPSIERNPGEVGELEAPNASQAYRSRAGMVFEEDSVSARTAA